MKKIVLLILFSPFILSAQKKGKIIFYQDTLAMKQEIIKYIPIGSNVEDAKKVLKKNRIKFVISKDADLADGMVMRKHLDYIYIDRSKHRAFSWITRRWQIALVFNDEKITEVIPSFGLIGP